MNDESLASCPISSSSSKMQQFDEQVKAVTNVNQEKAVTNVNQEKAASPYEKEFLSAGLWLSTVVFLSMTIVFAGISGILAFFNIFYNPSQFLLSTFGLYFWNGVTIALCLLTMIFYSSLFLIFISENIGITDTLSSVAHYSSNDLAGLGFSFWILFVTIAFHLGNIGVVYYRNYLLQREPRAPAITVNKNDSTILVY